MTHCFISYPHTDKYYISNTRRSISSDIQTPRSNISNTRKSVSSGIQTPRIIKHEKEHTMYHLISKHRELTYQTRGVFHLISKHRELSNTRSVSSDIQTPRTNKSNRTNALSDNQNPRSDICQPTLRSNISNT